MAAAAGRPLLLLLSSRGGGGGAGGCGALTAGCFPGLGVSRHRQQHHRTVSERARRLRGGRGGAGVWESPPAGRRGSGRVPSTRGRSRGCWAPRSRRALQAPAATTRKRRRAEEAEGRRRGDGGDVPAGPGTPGREGTGLEPFTRRPKSWSLLPF